MISGGNAVTVNSNEMRLPILTFLGNSGKIATICDMSVEQD